MDRRREVKGTVCATLAPGVRARREEFGLLFYHSGTTLLTFVKSGNLFDVTPDGKGRLCLTTGSEGSEGGDGRTRVLQTLKKKGLLSDTFTSI